MAVTVTARLRGGTPKPVREVRRNLKLRTPVGGVLITRRGMVLCVNPFSYKVCRTGSEAGNGKPVILVDRTGRTRILQVAPGEAAVIYLHDYLLCVGHS